MEIDDLVFAVITIPLFFITLVILFFNTVQTAKFQLNWNNQNTFLGLLIFTYFMNYHELPKYPEKLILYKKEGKIEGKNLKLLIEVFNENKYRKEVYGKIENNEKSYYLIVFPILYNDGTELNLVQVKLYYSK